MIKVSVLYPNSEGSRFDMAYCCKTHIPLVQRLVGPHAREIMADISNYTNVQPVIQISEVKL